MEVVYYSSVTIAGNRNLIIKDKQKINYSLSYRGLVGMGLSINFFIKFGT